MIVARPVETGEIVQALQESGICSGDTVMVHSDALVAAQFPPMSATARYDLLIDAFLALLGSGGTLVMPTFTYSFSRGEIFDVIRTPSTVGAITEHFRQRPDVRRSRNPMFSVAASGRYAEEFALADPIDCFGALSAFAQLHARGGKIICIGCAFDRITFVHYVEQRVGVDYRYFKSFEGKIVHPDGETRATTVRCFVRSLDRAVVTDLKSLRTRMFNAGRLNVSAIGRVEITVVEAKNFYSDACDMLAENAYSLTREQRAGA